MEEGGKQIYSKKAGGREQEQPGVGPGAPVGVKRGVAGGRAPRGAGSGE